ncbi:hypothetical protein AB434_3439 [Heyndrickxia coagulans]|uniref:Uncharacterized protein n=1 Tax=Heyndrickxia coagulans TaxID=1398 RepID=A0AAN0WC63_HEYCO|nr:hypothetical protein SB48_HM08orf02902 [Heyndrickxia coagulans]AKN55844.1 hypothetical protein AB434_3439 [Heyndrickxia coagulans]
MEKKTEQSDAPFFFSLIKHRLKESSEKWLKNFNSNIDSKNVRCYYLYIKNNI